MRRLTILALLLVAASGANAQVALQREVGFHPDRSPVILSTTRSGTVDVLDVNVKSATVAPLNTAATVNISNPSITSTSSAALASNASRKWAQLQNTGSVDCTCSIAATPTTSVYGFKLYANGGSQTIDPANFSSAVVNCITSSGTTTLAVQEGQ